MKLKPFIKCAGGKGRVLKKIVSNFANYDDCYVEPFIGGGAILFDLQPKNAIISDINKDLINVYLMVKNNINELLKILKQISKEYLSKNNDDRKIYYYSKKDEYNKIKYFDEKINEKNHIIRIKCASLFMFLNRTGFNGMYRENQSGKYNIPFGKYKNPTIANEDLLNNVSKYLNDNNIEIFCQSYEATLEYVNNKYENDKNVLIYLDPPYYPSDSSKFTTYTKHKFHIREQEELSKIYSNQKYSTYLSNSNCDEIKELYKDYKILTIDVLRSISAKKSSRGIKQELLIIKNI